MISGVLWATSVVSNAVEFYSEKGKKIILLFDRSLSFGNNEGFEDDEKSSSSEDDE